MEFRNVPEPLSPPFPPSFLDSLASNAFLQLCYWYRWLILGSTLLSMVGAAAWSLSQAPIYQASTQLTFETQSNRDEANAKTNPLFQSLSAIQLETHINQLKSTQHLKETAENISKSNSPAYQSFVSRTDRTSLSQISWGKYLRDHIRDLAKKLSQWLPSSLSQFIEPNPQDPPRRLSQNSPEEQFATWLQEHVDIKRAIRTSSVTITAHAETPVFATQIANTVANVYVEKFSQPTHQTAPTYAAWKKSEQIKSELKNTQNTLEEAKAKLRTFLIEHPQVKQEDRVTESNKSQTEMSPIDAELTNLTKEVNQQESRYTTLLREIEPKPASPTIISERISITRPAFPVNSPIGPHPMLATLWGLPIGLGGGVGLAIFLEWIKSRKRYIKKPEDLKKIKPELPFLGWLSDSGSPEKGNLSPFLSDSDASGFVGEYIQQIIKGTNNAPSQEAPRNWLITSPGNHEGKTLLAKSMAKVLTQQASHSVLLIDANFSHPTLHTIVPLRAHNQQPNGLSDFLFNRAEINTIIQDTKISNLHVISVGQWAALPPEELPTDRFQQLLQWCKTAQYHVIIIGPPVLLTDEIAMFASQVEDTMVIVRPGTTSRKEIKLAIKQLKTHGAQISGIVFYRLAPEKKTRETESASHLGLQILPHLPSKEEKVFQPTSHHITTHQPHAHEKTHHERRETSQLTYFDAHAEKKRLKAPLPHLDNERRVHWKGGPYSAEFKANVALEALKELMTVDELAKQYQVHPVLISQWKRQIQRGAKELFENREGNADERNKPAQMELYAEIGRLKMEVDSLKKLPHFLTPKQK